MRNGYRVLLILEVLVTFFVMLVFRIIESRFAAAMTAGGLFILLGVVIVFAPTRGWIRARSATFWMGCLHLFFVALPMVAVRGWNAGVEFYQVRIWGIPGPEFHRLSTIIFLVLMLATLIDAIRARQKDPISP